MSMQQAAELFRQLGLGGMVGVIEDWQMNPATQSIPRDDLLMKMGLAQIHVNSDRRQKRLIKQAKFKVEAAPEDIDYRENRSLDREVIGNLLVCEWIKRLQNAIFTGLTGVGKTWLSCAIGMQACRKLIPVRYFRLSRLLEGFEIARGDGTLPKVRARLHSTPLVILDDWGVAPLTPRGRHDLLELIDDRYGERSVLITSQLPVDKWYDWLVEPTVAEAILDRLIHGAHRLEFTGESMRKRRANSA